MDWLSRLKTGLSKTSAKLGSGIVDVFTKRKLDGETLAELEELLVQADIGAAASARIIAVFGKHRVDKELNPEEIKAALAHEMELLLEPVARPFVIPDVPRPFVVLVVGVNGNGKTTTIGKLARQLTEKKLKVMLAAADTFRAAAVEQLKVWGERNDCEVIAGAQESDPASVAYAAVEKAKAAGADVLIIDSAGRLQNKANLMAELRKIITVIKKLDADAPHAVIQVLDATTGQNALSQVEIFKDMAQVTGLVITKLDGTAKGGIVLALADKCKLPIHAIGVGEGIEDLQPFSARDFARNIIGL